MGDGSFCKTEYELSFSTTSKHVAYGLRLLLARLGVISAVKTSRVEYKIHVSGTSKRKLLDMFGIDYDKDRKWENGKDRASQNEDFLMFPIKEINRPFYEGKLVDIQVANTNDFVAENIVVHNSWIEGMATRTPVIMPGNTAMSEFITPDKGYLVKSGGDPSLYTVCRGDNEVIRSLTDVNDMVSKMREVYYNRHEAKAKAEKAYVWATTKMDWQSCIVPQWVKLFDQAYEDLKKGVKPQAQKTEAVIGAEVF
jgi:hypothetical protein